MSGPTAVSSYNLTLAQGSYLVRIATFNCKYEWGPGYINLGLYTDINLTAPDAPSSLAATPGNGSAAIAFTAGPNGNLAITNMEYAVDDGSGFGSWTALAPADVTSPVTIPGLANGTEYTIKLRAVNWAGAGAESGIVTATPAGTTDVTVTASSPADVASGSALPLIGYSTSPATTASDWTTEPSCEVYASSDASFATPLTGVQSAGTYVTHCSGGTSSQYNPASYVDGSLTVLAPTPSGGGGGSSTPVDSATPTPSPAPTAAPSTPPLDPITSAENPVVPTGGLPQGGSLLLVDGAPTPVTVVPDSTTAPTGLNVSGGDWTMKLVGRGDDSDPLGLTDKAALILQSEQLATRAKRVAPVAQASGTGFKADSEVRFYLLPSTYLGALPTDASGAFSGAIPVPPGITPGDYTMQMNGYSPTSQVRSLSIGVLVKPSSVTVRTVSSAARVFFAPSSAELTPAGKARLKALVKRTGRYAVTVAAIGYVQRSGTSVNDQSLSTARAKAVSAYVRSLGVRGSYTVRGDGVGGPGAAARKVEVTIRHTR